MGRENTSFQYLFQLYNKKLIANRKIIYIKPYFGNGKLLESSELSIGKFPDQFVKNKTDLPSCRFRRTFSSFYTCEISDIILKNKKSNKEFKMEKLDLKAIFEEGTISKMNLPTILFDNFYEYFKEQKNCSVFNDTRTIKCSESSEKNNIAISIVMNNYEFMINNEDALWDRESSLNIEFNMEPEVEIVDGKEKKRNIAILTSAFSGNYHRIYDNFMERIYFSGVDGNIKFPNKPNEAKMYWLIYLIITGALLIIGLIVIIIVWTTTKKNIVEEVTAISFGKKREEEDEEDDDGGQILI